MDGEITIGTKLDTDKFDRQISQLEKKMKKEEDKKIVIDAKLGSQQQELDEARQKTDALADAYQRLKEAQNKVSTGQATPKEFTTFQDLQSTYGSLEQLGTQFDKALSKQEAIEQKVAQTKYRYDEINAKVSEYKQKIENVKIEKQVADVEKLKSGFNNVGSSIQGAVKHVARLVLGIFGLRSAFMFLRRASSDLASYDKQYGANLAYIRFALTQAIAPVLKWIVSLAAKLLGYINMIINALFGINLFSNASVKDFKKMQKATDKTAKSTKKIKDNIQRFDEVNKLTDNNTGDTGGGTPNFDLSGLQGEKPAWLKRIIDNKDLILSILAGIVAGLKAIKFGLGGIKALGIGVMVAGIVYTIQSLLKYLKDPSWENFGKVIQGIGIAIVGLGILIGNVPLIVAGAIVLIIGIIIKYWEQIKAFLQKGIDWLTGKSDLVHQMFGDTIGNIYDTFVKNLQIILNWIDGTFKNIKGAFDGFIQFIKGVFTGNWEQAWEGIKQIFSNTWQAILRTFGTFFTIIKNNVVAFARTAGDIIAGAFKIVVNAVLSAIERVLNSPIRAINRLIGVINVVPGINLSTLPTFNLPRLKVGGIINMPNKGTMLGSAIGGEAGREGVIPLTDQQAMAELGAEIGRHVLVNLTNITQMNGRVIGRELKQVQSEQEFAYNM